MIKKNFLRNLLFEEEKSENQESKKPELVEKNSSTDENQQSQVTDTTQVQGKVQPNYVDAFEGFLQQANFVGPDYFELKQSMEHATMKTTFPDEKQRILSAFMGIKMSNPDNFSKKVVLDSCDAYLNIIEEKRQSSLKLLSAKRKSEVDDVQAEIENDKKHILELENELAELRKKVLDQSNKVIEAQNQYAIKEADFNASADFVINTIKNDKEKFINILSNEQ